MSKEEVRMVKQRLGQLSAGLANDMDNNNVREASNHIEQAKERLEQALRYYDE